MWIATTAVAFEFGGVREATAVLVAQLLPAVATASLVGGWCDRWGERKVLVAGMYVQSVAMASIGILLAARRAACRRLRGRRRRDLGGLDDPSRDLGARSAARSRAARAVGGERGDRLARRRRDADRPGDHRDLHRHDRPERTVSRVRHSRSPSRRRVAIAIPEAACRRRTGSPDIPVRVALAEVARAEGSRSVLVLLASRAFVEGALDLLYVVIALDVLGGSGADAGWLNAAYGAGALVGASASVVLVGAARSGPPRPPARSWPRSVSSRSERRTRTPPPRSRSWSIGVGTSRVARSRPARCCNA